VTGRSTTLTVAQIDAYRGGARSRATSLIAVGHFLPPASTRFLIDVP